MTILALEPDTWNALAAIGSILGAFATVAAVIVALRLARRDLTPRLVVSSTIMQEYTNGPKRELFLVTGTNLGHVPLTVKGMYWTYGKLRKRTLIGMPVFMEGSTRLPAELMHGKQVQLIIPLAEFEKQAESIAEKLLKDGGNPTQLAKTLRCGLYTTIGKDFADKAGERVREIVIEKIRRLQEASVTTTDRATQ